MDLFEAKELELLVCGSKALNFEELRMGAKYDDGYDENSKTIDSFWTILLDFDEDEKRLFLKFLSGSDRSPIDGLAKLEMVISKNGSEGNSVTLYYNNLNNLFTIIIIIFR
jgi:ubiquitin-protein ligase E3 A